MSNYRDIQQPLGVTAVADYSTEQRCRTNISIPLIQGHAGRAEGLFPANLCSSPGHAAEIDGAGLDAVDIDDCMVRRWIEHGRNRRLLFE
jgi:hypothetical protein